MRDDRRRAYLYMLYLAYLVSYLFTIPSFGSRDRPTLFFGLFPQCASATRSAFCHVLADTLKLLLDNCASEAAESLA